MSFNNRYLGRKVKKKVKWLQVSVIIILLYVGFNRQPVYLSSLQQKDSDVAEIRRVQTFLREHSSPLQESAKDFVMAEKTYKVPAKLLVAIAGVESGFGKNPPSCAFYNPFGYSSSTSPCGWWRFQSYHDAIYKVAQTISTDRAYQGYQRTGSILELAKVYTAIPEDWTEKVNWFMNQI